MNLSELLTAIALANLEAQGGLISRYATPTSDKLTRSLYVTGTHGNANIIYSEHNGRFRLVNASLVYQYQHHTVPVLFKDNVTVNEIHDWIF